MFWFELRIGLSAALLLTQWYYIGWVQDFLHFIAVCELSRLARLPAEIEKVDFFFNDFHTCSAIAHGVQVKAPPLSTDDRWELEQIVTVDAVHTSFPLIESLFLYLFSFGGLAVVHSVHIYGLRVNVEGHRDWDDMVSFNVSLIGKRTKKSKNDDSLADGIEEQAKDMGMASAVLIENFYGGKDFSEPSSNKSIRTPSRKMVDASHHHQASPEHEHGDGILNRISERLSLWKEGAKALNETVVESGGIINATKAKLSDVYQKTKHSIEESIQDRIDALHVHLSGPEPIPSSDFRFVCDHLFYDRVEIHMLRALPPQIRHLESKPLIVERLEFFNLGRGSCNELVRTKHHAKHHSRTSSEISMMSPVQISSRDQHSERLTTDVTQKHTRPDNGSFMGIDLYEGGLDFRIFKYYFERRMLYALCKYNASKSVSIMRLTTFTLY